MKKFLSFLLTINLILMAWALPGFESYIPDNSGEYVYYQDTTFHRESYVGILYYDESTIQIRYFAPASKKDKLPENDISILISINPESDHWEMTGERILSTILPNTDDVEIVNYLHDMLYEFSAHRNRVMDLNARDIEIYQDFPQFGGKVVINYDCTIPLFNIRDIEDDQGNKLLKCVTVGQLLSNGDQSFSAFKGFPEDNYKKTRKHYKKAKPVECKFNNQSVTLDEKWQQVMENIWALGDDSFLSMGQIPTVFKDDKSKTENFLIKNFAKSKQGSYINYNTLKINSGDDELQIIAETYNPENGKTAINNIIISKSDDENKLNFFSLATFKQPWLNNEKYYKDILDSYNY